MARTTITVEVDDPTFESLKAAARQRSVSVETLAGYWFEQWWNRRPDRLKVDPSLHVDAWAGTPQTEHSAADRAEQGGPDHPFDPACWCPDCQRRGALDQAAQKIDGLVDRVQQTLEQASASILLAEHLQTKGANTKPAPEALRWHSAAIRTVEQAGRLLNRALEDLHAAEDLTAQADSGTADGATAPGDTTPGDAVPQQPPAADTPVADPDR